MAVLLAFLLSIAALAAPAAADVVEEFDNTECNRSLDAYEEPTCVWSSAVGCEECAGVCLAAAPESNVQFASQAATLAVRACTSLAGLINGQSREAVGTSSDSEFGAVEPALNCPSAADVTTHFDAAVAALKAAEDGAVYEDFETVVDGALESADELIKYFDHDCNNVSTGPETFMCMNSADAVADNDARLEAIGTECTAAIARVENGACLSLGAITHIDKECLMSHDVSTVDEDTATAISTAFSALHTACSAITTEEECNGDAAAAQVTAASGSIVTVEMPAEFGSHEHGAAAASWASLGVVAAFAAVIL